MALSAGRKARRRNRFAKLEEQQLDFENYCMICSLKNLSLFVVHFFKRKVDVIDV